MTKIKMVVTDLDGTLLKDDKHISAYTAQVIDQLREQNIVFAVATARPPRSVKVDLPWVKFDAGIFHNGAWLEVGAERLDGFGIRQASEWIRELLVHKPAAHVAMESEDVLYANFDASTVWPGIGYIATEDFTQADGKVANKIIIEAFSVEEMNQYQPYLPEQLYMHLSENRIAMIMDKRATKVNGILQVAEKLQIKPEEIVTFGDDHNDLEMLRRFGRGIAMENAFPEIREAIAEHCLTNEQDGEAKWLRQNLLNYVAPGAYVGGDVTLGRNVGIWYNAVVRGDSGPIFLGDDSNVQDNSTVHTDPGHEVHIGKGVTIGHNAIVHGCTVGDHTIVGMGSILLNGAVVGKDCLVGAGALVTGKMVVPDGHLVLGNPAKVIRRLTPEEIEGNRKNAEHYVNLARAASERSK